MKKSVLITGVSGSGKSTLSAKLREQGCASYDLETIPGLFRCVYRASGAPFAGYDSGNAAHVREAKWVCDKDALRKILAEEPSALSFYAGTSSNVEELMELFDTVIVLSASEELTRERLTHRTSHDYGKTKDIQDWIFSWKSDWERSMQGRGAIIVDSDRSVDAVAEDVIRIAKAD